MGLRSGNYAGALRRELAALNREWARGRPHVESYGENPVVAYCPENDAHGNFYAPAYRAILARPTWARRLNKVHAQGRSLPKWTVDPHRKWRELDSCMSSDALLMNVFCTPGVATGVRPLMGVQAEGEPEFGWKAKVPLNSGLFDRTEVDMRWGDLLVEAKLTESDFQTRKAALLESYRDFDAVFDRDLLPKVEALTGRRRSAEEFHEEYSQEWEDTGPLSADEVNQAALDFQAKLVAQAESAAPREVRYKSCQLIRNVLAAHAVGARFCLICDGRRPDLIEAWFDVMRAVPDSRLRTRLNVLTWQGLSTALPAELRAFLEVKYGVGALGAGTSSVDETE